MAKSGLSVDQTRGTFQVRGIVSGVSKQNFYTDKMTKTNKPWRKVNFGLRISKDELIYLEFNGMPQEKVYFSTSTKDKDGNKLPTVNAPWSERHSFKKENYQLIGMNIGLEKIQDGKGNEVNDIKHLTSFDAAEYVKNHMSDGQSVFIKGNLEYGHYAGNNGEVVRTVKYIPTQISLCKDVVFDGLDKEGKPYQVVSDFSQHLVYMDLVQGQDDLQGKFVLSAKIVNYSTIEDAEFIIEDEKLARNIRKTLKEYQAIKTWGKLVVVRNTDTVEVEEDDGWGKPNPMNRQTSPYKTIRLITGADKDSLDTVNYTEEKIDEAIAQMKKEENKAKDFETPAGGDDWGSKKAITEEDSEVPWN